MTRRSERASEPAQPPLADGTPSGWFKYGDEEFVVRYWDGSSWTGKTDRWESPLQPPRFPPSSEEFQRLAAVREHKVLLGAGIPMTALGGYGWDVGPGQKLTLVHDKVGLRLLATSTDFIVRVAYSDLRFFDISGPGTQTSSAGVIGGGVGVTGAAEGILAAALINAVTRRTEVTTYVYFATDRAEVFLLQDSIEPLALRIALSEIFVRWRSETNQSLGPTTDSE